MQKGGYPLRAKALAPATTQTEFIQTANELDQPVDYAQEYARFNTAEKMAGFLLEFYDGDKTVGEMDFTTNKIKLSNPKHPPL